jgi:hypothetical protein
MASLTRRASAQVAEDRVELADIVARLRETGVEFEDVEVKRAAGGLRWNVAETMSAFANSRGGTIILGLDERAGFAAVGVSDPVALRNELAGVARVKLTPALAPVIDTVPFESAILVLAEIESLPPPQRPCYVTARGLYNGAFINFSGPAPPCLQNRWQTAIVSGPGQTTHFVYNYRFQSSEIRDPLRDAVNDHGWGWKAVSFKL